MRTPPLWKESWIRIRPLRDHHLRLRLKPLSGCLLMLSLVIKRPKLLDWSGELRRLKRSSMVEIPLLKGSLLVFQSLRNLTPHLVPLLQMPVAITLQNYKKLLNHWRYIMLFFVELRLDFRPRTNLFKMNFMFKRTGKTF